MIPSRPAFRRWLTGCMIAAAWVFGPQETAYADGARVDIAHAQEANHVVTAPTTRGQAVLTVDPELQRDVDALLDQARASEGAIVVIDVRTGRALAWASNDPSGRDLVATPYAPPASLFKVVTAAALIEDENVPPTAHQCYVGGQRSARLSNLRSSGAGGARCETFDTAVGYSRNMVMAGLAVRHLEAPALRTWARNLGFTGNIPADVDVEPGELTVQDSKEGVARAAAGFGEGKLSVLGAAYMMSIIANGGVRPQVSLIDYLVGPEGQHLDAPFSPGAGERVLRVSTARRLTSMLEVTVREGTAAHAFRDLSGNRYLGRFGGVGKTGTLARGNPGRLFSWYAGFAPAQNPQVAVAVMLANGNQWWRKANEVARDVLRSYFSRQHGSGVTNPIRGRRASSGQASRRR